MSDHGHGFSPRVIEKELVDAVLGTNDSVTQIARHLGWREDVVRRRIKRLGLDWTLKQRREAASRGQAALLNIIRRLAPGEEVVTEHPVGERLLLDVYCPRYRLAAEFHGRQHFEYVAHFHGDRLGFVASQQRDARKAELCRRKGIALVVFSYKDDLSEDAVFERLRDAICDRPPPPPPDEYRERQRSWRRKAYQMRKAERR